MEISNGCLPAQTTLPFRCAGCGGAPLSSFYVVRDVPVHSVLLMRSREQARSLATGDIRLAYCPQCGFISNVSFDGSSLNYSAEYEETQGFSATFDAFHRDLAARLIERHGLRKKTVFEIGCGKGEFLTLLCEMGHNRGVGFDPAYVPERNHSPARHRIEFVREYFSSLHVHAVPDFVCCKMTLEHVPNVASFMRTVREAIQPGTLVFFQIPDARRVLQDVAFWDVYYEHCSYFSKESLARLFSSQRFDVENVWSEYDGQYLMIEASAGDGSSASTPPDDELTSLHVDVQRFEAAVGGRIEAWRHVLREMKERGERVVLWGGGSKAVAFLTTLRLGPEILGAVDINPYRAGTFLAGTGHEIISPSELGDVNPSVVIIMNSIYRDEIARSLSDLRLSVDLLLVDGDPKAQYETSTLTLNPEAPRPIARLAP